MATFRMSYINSPVTYTMDYFTIPDRLEMMANKLREKEVYVFVSPNGKRESITALELHTESTNLARQLVGLGLQKGDVVACCIPNTLNSLVCTFGIICAGGVVMNLIISQKNFEAIKDAMIRTEAKGLILDPGNDDFDLEACMKFVKSNHGNGTVSSCMIPNLKILLTTKKVDGFGVINTKENVRPGEFDVRLPRIDPEDIAVIFSTSGTTGAAKFVPQSHHFIMIVGYQLEENMLFEPDDIIYTERRLAWIGGFPFPYLHNGAKTVTKTAPFASLKDHCKFTAKVIENENCNIACLLPATIIGINDEWIETKSPNIMLKNIHCGGLPLADVCMDAVGRFTKAVTNCYGSSEGASFAATIIKDKGDFESYCCGFPTTGVEIKIVDEDGMVVPREQTGVVHVRSPTLFWQYLNDPEKTRQVLSVSHWMDTDDVGYISDDGKLTVSGRKSDLILQSGKYFAPSKVEAFIKSHKDVLDAVVVSIPDDAKFALVCACVIGKQGRNLTEDSVKQYLETEYQFSAGEAFSHAGPEHVLIYEDFPRLYTGKPDKKRLRDDAISRLGRYT